jgi:2-oxoglutarate dehydrogenase E2 component (dihydrolipoamide succinyltransferase)
MVHWRDRIKKEFEKREGEKITYTPIFVEAIAKCLKKYPMINSSIDGDRIIIKKDLNIGMATALPSGNLIVPVIRNADQLNLVGLTKQVNGLANAARNNKLKPDDTAGGTFTLTNVGTFGSIMGTPIINQPQVAIMAVGAIKKRPMVIETPMGDMIAIRHMMYISLSYDHRIVDGALGSTFLNAVSKELEAFDTHRAI